MPLNYPTLELPDSPETVAYRTIDRILSTDPTLKRVVRHYNAWTGEATDGFEPTFATCPSIQLYPMAGPGNWEAEGQHRLPLIVGFRLGVAGSNIDQLMNFWGAIRRALWPPEVDSARFQQVREWVVAANITRPTIKTSGFAPKVEEGGAKLLVADYQIELLLHVNTP